MTMARLGSMLLVGWCAAGCSSTAGPKTDPHPGRSVTRKKQSLPPHLRSWPGLSVRRGRQIVAASAEDVAVAKSYPRFAQKGPLKKGQRITILTKTTRPRVGEPVRVIHVLEAPEPGHRVYVMGPKAIVGEYVDGKRVATPKPLALSYDGAVVPSPAVDYNYDITEYRFDRPGRHTIQWRGGGHAIQGDLQLESNVLVLTVVR